MIQTLTDIPSDGLQVALLTFTADGANIPPWNPAVLTDLTVHLAGVYRQADGNWTVMTDVPDVPGGNVPAIPPAGPTPPATNPAEANGYNVGPNDPLLQIQSPANFTIYTNLKQTVSTLTVDAIDTYFKDKPLGQQALAGIGQPVIDAARKYGINATYIVAHAILESGWGNSNFAVSRHNLFGWFAFDTRPDLAKGFDDNAECIDFVMGRVNALYLDSAGKWYRGGPYVGNLQSGMNVKYATEADWGTSIARIANEMGASLNASGAGGPAPAVTQKVRGTTGKFVVNRLVTGGKIPIPHGTFTLIGDDNQVIDSMEANTGGYVSDYTQRNGPIPPGTYRIDNYLSPRNDEGEAMRYFDVSFSFSLTPLPGTNVYGRDGLDIHPDGPPPGTHGCIGLVAQSGEELERFRDLLCAHTRGGSHLNVTVSYEGVFG